MELWEGNGGPADTNRCYQIDNLGGQYGLMRLYTWNDVASGFFGRDMATITGKPQ